jgi:solute carrier family 13 (sodium-dependent dicarboxylate transporter), member 2/3/5
VKTGNTLMPPVSTVFAGFTTDVVWLCLFAFMIGGMMQLMKLDRRIAMAILLRIRASSVGSVIWGITMVAFGEVACSRNSRPEG